VKQKVKQERSNSSSKKNKATNQARAEQQIEHEWSNMLSKNGATSQTVAK
jgi:hypothetical protein